MVKKLFMLLVALLLLPNLAWAKSPPDKHAPVAEVSAVRYYENTDAATGAKSLRLVLDVTGSVQASAALNSLGSQLTVGIAGAAADTLARTISVNSSVVSSVNVSATGGASSRFVVNLPAAITSADYTVTTLPADPQTGKPFRVVIDIGQPVLPPSLHFSPGLKGKIIVIDPGHGGSDSGAIGPDGVMEKTVTLAVSFKVKSLLEQAGATVHMTREEDRDVFAPNDSAVEELGARAQIANNDNADVFICIHADSFPNRSIGGTASYYYQKSSYDRLLAQSFQNGLVSTDGLQDRGVHSANFYVLKHTQMPASLIELAFISNPTEEDLLTQPPFQEKLAEGIVDGLKDFFAQAAGLGGQN